MQLGKHIYSTLQMAYFIYTARSYDVLFLHALRASQSKYVL